MPSLPEIRRISGQKRAREIKRKLKTEQLGATTSDVGVTRKIEKYLKGNRKTARPCSEPTWMRRRIVEVRVRHDGESISKDHLFEQTG